MSTYLLINLCILLVPSIAYLLNHHKVRWLKQRLLPLLVIGIPFVYWDQQVAKIGHWGFSAAHITGITVFRLPIEEVLFFISVPLAMLTIYDGIRIKKKVSLVSARAIIAGIGILAGLLANISKPNSYSSIVAAVTIAVAFWLYVDKDHISTKKFWAFHAWGLFLFIITNSILTAIPIVTYGPDFITNARIGTIPIEDFFYNFSMLTGYILVYDYAKKT